MNGSSDQEDESDDDGEAHVDDMVWSKKTN